MEQGGGVAITAPTIVAIGGGSFSTDHSRPTLEDYVLGLTGKEKPRVCFIPTASGDHPSEIANFYAAFDTERCQPSHLTLFDRRVGDLTAFLLDQDVVYVGGGNTATMVAIWQLHGLDDALREAWEKGVILSGSSAGASCWHEDAVVDSFGPLSAWTDGLGFVKGSLCPHYDSEPARRELFKRFIEDESLTDGFGLETDVAIRYEDDQIVEVVSTRPDGRAWRVEKIIGGGVRETELVPRYLGEER